jgi:CheY-like chemotaxis protein
MVQIILARHGIRVLTAPDPQTALDLVEKKRQVTCVLHISDIAMPKMNGFSLAEAVRAQFPNIQVLYMSGYPWDSIRETHHSKRRCVSCKTLYPEKSAGSRCSPVLTALIKSADPVFESRDNVVIGVGVGGPHQKPE